MIDRIEKHISYSEFVEKYLKANRPVIFSQNVLIGEWSCSELWVENNKFNTNFFNKLYGQFEAPVMDCNKKFFSSHEKVNMKVSDFLSYWEHRDERLLYLKDWHLQRATDEPFYEVPFYFSSDWLNEYFDYLNTDDYRFVYIGVKGSWTPFHVDVFRSYSWSANICGLKKWIFYPPGEENNLKDKFGQLPFDVLKIDDKQLKTSSITIYQKAGEVIFVPSGWHHQVFNLEDTVSINHNWMNAYSIKYLFHHLQSELVLVKLEINDCVDMEGFEQQCQIILNSLSGINFNGFFKMIKYIAHKRLKLKRKKHMDAVEYSSVLNELFITSQPRITKDQKRILAVEKVKQFNKDLKALHKILSDLLEHDNFKNHIFEDLLLDGHKLKNDLLEDFK